MADAELLLYAESHADGRSFTTTVRDDEGGGVVLRNTARTAEGVRAWGRAYTPEEAHAVVALLGGGAEDLDAPARFLHRLAAEGDLPADQTFDGWLADHGLLGTPHDEGGADEGG